MPSPSITFLSVFVFLFIKQIKNRRLFIIVADTHVGRGLSKAGIDFSDVSASVVLILVVKILRVQPKPISIPLFCIHLRFSYCAADRV